MTWQPSFTSPAPFPFSLISSLSITATNTSSLSFFIFSHHAHLAVHHRPSEKSGRPATWAAPCAGMLFSQPLATLAKFNLEHGNGPDIYGISEIDGFNLLCGSPA